MANRMTGRLVVSTAMSLTALLCAVCGQAPAEDQRRVAEDYRTLGWRLGVASYSLRKHTFFEAVDRTASLKQKYIEGYFLHRVSEEIPKRLDFNLNEAEIAAVRRKLELAGVRMRTYYIHKFPPE